MNATSVLEPVRTTPAAARRPRPFVVAAHQPNFFPNPAFFYKWASCDLFLILDDVQFRRRGYVNRNRIKTAQGIQWLSVPVCVKGKYHARIREMMPDCDPRWPRRHLRTLMHAYRRAPHYEAVMEQIVVPAYSMLEPGETSLASFNVEIIRRMGDYLSIQTVCRFSSAYHVQSSSTARLAGLVSAVGGSRYLSGVSGRKYLDENCMTQSGIELSFVEFAQPAYPQLWGEFAPNLSMLDALFNLGQGTRDWLPAKP